MNKGSLGSVTPVSFQKAVLLLAEKRTAIWEIEALVVEHGLPWLDTVSTIEGARRYCSSQEPKSPWVTKEARAYLEVANGA
jgi:hypothetical protein